MTKQMAQQFVNPREAAFLSVKNAFKSTKDAERERDYASLASGQLDRLSLLDPASEEAQAEPVFNTPIVQTDEAAVESIRTLLVSTDLDGIPNTVQRQLQASGGPNLTQELMPLRTPLRTRRAKRCRACRHILCKFETRQPVMQAVKFRIRLAASSYLPTLTLSRTQHEVDSATTGGAEAAQQKSVYLLKIANPLYEQIKVTLSAPRVTELGDEVVVIAPEILIGGYTDVWEMPQSSTSAASSQGLVSSKKGTEAVLGKLHSSGSNWATIEMHLSRRQLETSSAWASVGDVSVPLFVSVEFEAEQELEDPDKAAPVASSKLTRKIGFWTVLTARQSPV
jgi:dynactin-4